MNKRKVITILSTVLLLVALPVSVFLVGKQQNLFLKASPEEVPKEIKIANISDNSFSVSWFTGNLRGWGLLLLTIEIRRRKFRGQRTTLLLKIWNLEPATFLRWDPEAVHMTIVELRMLSQLLRQQMILLLLRTQRMVRFWGQRGGLWLMLWCI